MSEKKDEKEIKEDKESDVAPPVTGNQELEECKKQKEEYLAGWQRARADLLNYKKEEIERMSEILKSAGQESVLKILPILDSFEAAERAIPESLKEDGNFKGFLMIKIQIQDFLKNQGLEEIKSVGEIFDPNLHEVVGQVEIKGKESGVIAEEVQKGYKVNGRLLRPVKVKVVK
ncbi:MAG: nucleotide exchange factor GrpE [bacterium]|nr:nucleotide exchange factor GrpE [bacterium]